MNTAGRGTLTIQNGNLLDAVAVLYRQQRTGEHDFLAVYIRSSEHAKLENIPPSSFVLRFMLGRGWNEDRRDFLRDAVYRAFPAALRYEETDSDEGDGVTHHFNSYSVTLHAVPTGNVRVLWVAPGLLRFPNLARDK